VKKKYYLRLQTYSWAQIYQSQQLHQKPLLFPKEDLFVLIVAVNHAL
jgi:hypothetical protein